MNNPNTDINSYYSSSNRMNNAGESLERYIKDIFCNSLHVKDEAQKAIIYSENFSYLGNQNNPPDIIIKGGDAIEVKKIESPNSGIALNSSYPKDKLYVESPMITKFCRECEVWIEKDILYIIGAVKNNKLNLLWFIYGDCYAADKDFYERIKTTITTELQNLQGLELASTNELGRVNKVDPLGITYLRIRGMWHIENPNKVFKYIISHNIEANFTLYAILLKSKYDSFPIEDKLNLENITINGFSIKDIWIKSPNNSAKMLEAKLISFVK